MDSSNQGQECLASSLPVYLHNHEWLSQSNAWPMKQLRFYELPNNRMKNNKPVSPSSGLFCDMKCNERGLAGLPNSAATSRCQSVGTVAWLSERHQGRVFKREE